MILTFSTPHKPVARNTPKVPETKDASGIRGGADTAQPD